MSKREQRHQEQKIITRRSGGERNLRMPGPVPRIDKLRNLSDWK